MNNLINEYLKRSKSLLEDVNIEYYRDIDKILNFKNKIEKKANKTIHEINNNPILAFQSSTIKYITNGIETFEYLLFNEIISSIKGKYMPLLYIGFIIGIILNTIIYEILVKTTINKKIKEIKELINTIFFVPLSVVNISPKFKRFIETGEIDD